MMELVAWEKKTISTVFLRIEPAQLLSLMDFENTHLGVQNHRFLAVKMVPVCAGSKENEVSNRSAMDFWVLQISDFFSANSMKI